MISIKEIYLLNTILDKRNFFAIPSLENMKLPPLLAESVYASLMDKNILRSPQALTEEGAKLVKRMADYKDAKKYIKIGALIMGLYNDENGIALIYDPIHKLYDFKRVHTKVDLKVLEKQYPFLTIEKEKETTQAQKISYKELKEKYTFKFDNTIYLSTFDMVRARKDRKAATTNEILFYCEENHYRYDRDQQMLYTSSAVEAKEILAERMVLQ